MTRDLCEVNDTSTNTWTHGAHVRTPYKCPSTDSKWTIIVKDGKFENIKINLTAVYSTKHHKIFIQCTHMST
jgi:hypothetical protein